MKEKINDLKFTWIISWITLLLLCISNYLYRNTLWAPKRIISLTAIIALTSFLWFIRLWVKQNWIKRILTMLVCSLALAGACFWLNHSLYDMYWHNMWIIMLAISGISVVVLLLLLIWKDKKKENKK